MHFYFHANAYFRFHAFSDACSRQNSIHSFHKDPKIETAVDFQKSFFDFGAISFYRIRCMKMAVPRYATVYAWSMLSCIWKFCCNIHKLEVVYSRALRVVSFMDSNRPPGPDRRRCIDPDRRWLENLSPFLVFFESMQKIKSSFTKFTFEWFQIERVTMTMSLQFR